MTETVPSLSIYRPVLNLPLESLQAATDTAKTEGLETPNLFNAALRSIIVSDGQLRAVQESHGDWESKLDAARSDEEVDKLWEAKHDAFDSVQRYIYEYLPDSAHDEIEVPTFPLDLRIFNPNSRKRIIVAATNNRTAIRERDHFQRTISGLLDDHELEWINPEHAQSVHLGRFNQVDAEEHANLFMEFLKERRLLPATLWFGGVAIRKVGNERTPAFQAN